MTIIIIRKGLIYFPDFCQIVLERFRENEAEEEEFRKTIFKVTVDDNDDYDNSKVAFLPGFFQSIR